ncbi:MAG: ABC transporter ATP-binding protein [Nitrospiraceae bacterium]|nr:ABC transporter ATP-binding protein [Nitrospiraceae bacterium]
MSRNPLIVFEGVSKSYTLHYHFTGGIKNFLFHLPSYIRKARSSSYCALKDVSFEIRRGETFGIIGKNGAGKSTILGIIAGVLKPTRGKVAVGGRISPLLELGAGFSFELTGRENILLNGIILGLTRKKVLDRMDEIIEFSGLGEFVDQPIRTYSSGMLSKLAFSVVTSLDPEILLIDEILAVGDLNFQQKCLEKMMSFKKSGVTIVFVSHSMKQVEQICDRAMWLENHVVRAIGDPGTITGEYSSYWKDR